MLEIAPHKASAHTNAGSDSHLFDPSILREYDIRGVVGETLHETDSEAIGLAFGALVKKTGGKRICIARDGRLHSEMLYKALSRGLKRVGIEVTGIGVGPTPMLYFADRTLDTDGAVMVTGSHNPAEYNGFKLVLGHRPFFGDDIQCLAQIAAEGGYDFKPGKRTHVDILNKYVNCINSATIDRPLKVAWDPGNGAAGKATEMLTQRLPGKHILINSKIDGTFPNHHPDPTVPENLMQLRDVVVKERCAFGIAFDGDGDRIGVIDNTGEVLWGDQILALIAEHVLHDNPGATIIADVKASQVLFDRVAQLGGAAKMWKTGHSLIKTEMARSGALLAGEMSGHMFFADRYFGFDDALYAAVRFIECVSQRTQPLSHFRKGISQTVNTPELRIDCAEDQKVRVITQISEALKQSGADVVDIDGVRVNTDDGWWLLRASNTQPVLVARCEASTAQGLEKLKTILINHLKNAKVEIPSALRAN